MAVWSTAFVNNLPDSSFGWIEGGGSKDSEGKTTPRSLRHLPYKDGSGKPDLAHVRNALARLSQTHGIPSGVASSLKSRLQAILKHNQGDDVQRIVQHFSVDAENELVWVHAYPYRTYQHPTYGEIDLSRDVAEEMYDNWANKVLERDIATNFDHGEDPTKGKKASGWIEEVEVKDDGLWVGVKPTPTALKELKDGEWRYASVERLPEWTNETTGVTYNNVLYGLAFTNHPFAKGVAPINLSDFGLYNGEPELPQPDPVPDPEPPQEDLVDREKLAEQLGLPKDATDEDINSRIQALNETEKRAAKPEDVKVQKLKDAEPELYAEIMAGRELRLENEAQKFAEGVKTEDGKVLAPEHKEAVVTAHHKLSKNEITVTEFAQVMAEATTKGMVNYREFGSSQPPEDQPDNARDAMQQLADGAAKLAKAEGIEYMEAVARFSEENPELAKAATELRLPVLAIGGDE